MSTEHVYDRKNTEQENVRGWNSSNSVRRTIPRPLVQTNRAFLVISILTAIVFSKIILVVPLLTGLLSLVFRWNPVMAIGSSFLSKPPSEYRQEDSSDQRFNQWIATVLLVFSIGSFSFGAPVPGYIFSGMVVLAAGVALMGFCVGCYFHFQLRRWHYMLEKNTSN